MNDYVVLAWSPQTIRGVRHRLRSDLHSDGFILSHTGTSYWVFTRGASVRVLEHGRGVVIGDLYNPLGARAPRALPIDQTLNTVELAHFLTTAFWGRYAAFIVDQTGATHAFRDPSGAMDALTWTTENLTIVASSLCDVLLGSVGDDVSIGWETVHRFVAHPIDMTAGVALTGIEGVAPGELYALDKSSPKRVQIWSPARFARAARVGTVLAEVLQKTVDRCVQAHAHAGRAIVEASGGFDSSLVAVSLSAAGADIATLLNYATSDASGDERRYAQALSNQIDRPLAIRWKKSPDFSPQGLASGPFAARPSLMGLDDDYDVDAATICQTAGAELLFTGQGGDAAFFQFAQPAVIVDRTRRLGWASLWSPELPALARWTRRSAFSLARLGIQEGSNLVNRPPGTPWILPAPAPRHPWLAELEDIPPAKRFQIENIAYTLLNHGVSRRALTVNVVHPLLSQPIVELCLQIPADLLVQGGRDRALARTAFHDRLPPLITARRSKGELGMIYGRSVSAALPTLRPFLLEGRLASNGIINAARLEPLLDPAYLAQNGGFLELLRAAAIEAWVRHWESKIASTRLGRLRA